MLELYKLAADKGDLNARLLLGHLYQQGSLRVAQDFRRALHYYRSVATLIYTPNGTKKRVQNADSTTEQAAAQAAAMLGEMYWRGEGVKQSNATALLWFKHAAEYGEPIAQNALGVMYRDGSEVKQDTSKAIKYFLAAAKQGLADAHTNLGLLYYSKFIYHLFYYIMQMQKIIFHLQHVKDIYLHNII
jgi:TPR repeat protein